MDLHVSRVFARITSAGLCGGGGLYVRVAGIRVFEGDKTRIVIAICCLSYLV